MYFVNVSKLFTYSKSTPTLRECDFRRSLDCVYFTEHCKIIESSVETWAESTFSGMLPLTVNAQWDHPFRNSTVITFMSPTNEKTDVILLYAWCGRRSSCKSVLATRSGWKVSQNENGKSREPLSIIVAFTSPSSKESQLFPDPWPLIRKSLNSLSHCMFINRCLDITYMNVR